MSHGARILEQSAELGGVSEDAQVVTRRHFPEHFDGGAGAGAVAAPR